MQRLLAILVAVSMSVGLGSAQRYFTLRGARERQQQQVPDACAGVRPDQRSRLRVLGPFTPCRSRVSHGERQ